MPVDLDTIKHGTYGGWQQERRYAKEEGIPFEPCDPCRLAYNAYANSYYHRLKDSSLKWALRRRAAQEAREAKKREVQAPEEEPTLTNAPFADEDDW